MSNAPQCATEEKHLVDGSEEKGYWAHGYLSALLDVKRLFTRDITTQEPGTGDASRFAA